MLTDDNTDTASSYAWLAYHLNAHGKYAEAQLLYEKASQIYRRLLTDLHPDTALGFNNLANNLCAQGRYLEVQDRWLSAVKSLDQARIWTAFAGLERAVSVKEPVRPQSPPCWPGSVNRPLRGNRSRRTWAAVCSTSWPPAKATSLLMTRFYQNLLGKRAGSSKPVPKAEALREAKAWLRGLTVDQVASEVADHERGKVRLLAEVTGTPTDNSPSSPRSTGIRPFDQPYYWAAFVLVGDPN